MTLLRKDAGTGGRPRAQSPAVVPRRRSMVAAAACAATAVVCAAPAAAQDLGPTASPPARGGAAANLPSMLPGMMAAAVSRDTAVASGWGGYDLATRAPVVAVTTEVRALARLALIAGAAYAAPNAGGGTGGTGAAMRPQIGARLQLLDQARHGVDVGVAFVFREDRFGAEDGLFQGSLLLGRRFGATAVSLNVAYAQDGEGDDHEGELRAAVLTGVGSGLHVGLDGHARHALASTDPRRATLGTPSAELFVGPVAAYTYGPLALLAEVGGEGVWTARLRGGLVAMGGIGAVF